MQTMTPPQALALLDEATQPQNVGKLNRQDYVKIQVALEVLAQALTPEKPSEPVAGA